MVCGICAIAIALALLAAPGSACFTKLMLSKIVTRAAVAAPAALMTVSDRASSLRGSVGDYRTIAPKYVLGKSFDISAPKTTRSFDFAIARQTTAPDGFVKVAYTINGQMPGPVVEANEGDTIRVTVHNNLEDESTSLHWHGMQQNGTQNMDGVPGFSQCPIPPGEKWTYAFDTSGKSGTYWYHSHSSVQYSDGILGPLIIHSPNEAYVRGKSYDSEVIIFVQDWYHDRAADINKALLSQRGFRSSNAAPPPQSGLINGRGVFDCSRLERGPRSPACATPPAPTLLVPSERVRFRVINGGSHVEELVSIDEYPLTVIAADGTATMGSIVHRIPVHNGERYDVLVDLSNAPRSHSVWLRAQLNTNCFAYQDPALDAMSAIVLRIGDAQEPAPLPSTKAWSETIPSGCQDLDAAKLVPVMGDDAHILGADGSAALRVFDSNIGNMTAQDGRTYERFFFNGTSYLDTAYQPFLRTLSEGGNISASPVSFVVIEDTAWVADIVVNNRDTFIDHPYHLHGMDFYIVGRGAGALTATTWTRTRQRTMSSADRRPHLRRDTLVIPRSSFAVLRLAASVPGVWPLHCHIAWHLSAGFMAALVVHPAAIAQRRLWTPASEALCKAGLAQGAHLTDTEPGR